MIIKVHVKKSHSNLLVSHNRNVTTDGEFRIVYKVTAEVTDDDVKYQMTQAKSFVSFHRVRIKRGKIKKFTQFEAVFGTFK